ncbi:MAG: carbohydrate ABC transporter permease [Actinomycetota bacterium]|jgi:alpha-glucoside transport system permease protein|nr:carbohydrate ABC transporter permease [Acidimicrobiia bacterium]MDQ3391059.1 carbohydrate ABC transporter permease [Actinomycetota bacterium]
MTRRLSVHVTLAVVSVIWLIPVLGLVISSFRPAAEVSTSGWWNAATSPGELTWSNYSNVLDRGGLWQSMANSVLVSVPATALTVTVAAIAAYGFSRIRFRFRGGLLMLFVALLIIPQQITLVPLLSLYNDIGLTGTFVGLWLVHLGYSLPFAVYLLHRFFAGLPGELFEAASLDGASHLQTFVHIVLPVSRPALASLAIFEFVWNWNDLLTALVFLGGNRQVAPLTVAVSNLVASRGEGWQVLTAAALVSMVIPMIVFVAMQKQFIRGILAGATKA